MYLGKPTSPARLRWLLPVLALCGAALLAACSGPKPAAPPEGSITDDRALGDIMVRFTPPPVETSLQAGQVLGEIKGPVRFVVKRPMSGGVWLVTAISPEPDATLDQALETLRAVPRVQTAEPDRLLRPHRARPEGRDLPAQ